MNVSYTLLKEKLRIALLQRDISIEQVSVFKQELVSMLKRTKNLEKENKDLREKKYEKENS